MAQKNKAPARGALFFQTNSIKRNVLRIGKIFYSRLMFELELEPHQGD